MTLLHDFILNIMFCSTHSGTDLRKCSDMQLNFTRSCREYILNLFPFAIKRYKEITIIRMQNYKEKITQKPNKNHRACKLCRFPPKKYKMTKTVHYYSKWCIDKPYLYEQFNLCSASTCICIYEVVGGYWNAWSHPTVYSQVLFVWFTCICQVSLH